MTAVEVLDVLVALSNAKCRVWVSGGWGVDALVGRQSRPHRDLDLAVDSIHEAAAISTLTAGGYTITTDWRPARVELAAAGLRWVDLHPVAFDKIGEGRQAGINGASFIYPTDCFAPGSIGGQQVPCLGSSSNFDP